MWQMIFDSCRCTLQKDVSLRSTWIQIPRSWADLVPWRDGSAHDRQKATLVSVDLSSPTSQTPRLLEGRRVNASKNLPWCGAVVWAERGQAVWPRRESVGGFSLSRQSSVSSRWHGWREGKRETTHTRWKSEEKSRRCVFMQRWRFKGCFSFDVNLIFSVCGVFQLVSHTRCCTACVIVCVLFHSTTLFRARQLPSEPLSLWG